MTELYEAIACAIYAVVFWASINGVESFVDKVIGWYWKAKTGYYQEFYK